MEYDFKTADFDETLNPDIVCDIRHIPLNDENVDALCAFEVLEHLPYDESLLALQELNRVSKRYVVISVPRSCFYFAPSLFFGLPIFYRILSLNIRIPFFWIRAEAGNKQHYWELGRKKYPISRFLKDIKKIGFNIIQNGHITL